MSETPEERAAEESAFQSAFAKIMTARGAIVKATGSKRGVAGTIPCPVCGGELRYSIANVNGHIHAACATKECVRWME